MIEVNTHKITSERIPTEFNGFKIAHISDFHNRKKYERILDCLKKSEADIIVITGDFIDSRKTKTQISLGFAKELVKIAPCYYIAGNHEARISEYAEFRQALTELGVNVLDDQKVFLEQAGQSVVLAGVSDLDFPTEIVFSDRNAAMRYKLSGLTNDETFTILLSHRPEFFETYHQSGAELVLCGHVHGGQIRIPFVGGLFTPDQGFFPKYDSGVYRQDNTCMVVSRGIGNSLFPLRVNNPPEVVLVELRCDS